MTSIADEKVSRLILKKFSEKQPEHHLASCPDREVIDPDVYEGGGCCWCDTCGEYVELKAVVACPHERAEFEWGQFGELVELLAEMEVEPD